MIHCAGGSAFTKQEKNEAEWRSGQTLPFSAGFATQLWFDREFVQQSIRLDLDQLESVCAQWLGHPLERPLRFALRPFSDSLERVWQRTMSYLRSGDEGGLLLTGPAKRTFDEFLLTLILHQHPHNYSEEMTATSSGPAPGLVRRAERFMIDNADAPITVSDVSAELGISVRSLQAGFRQWRSTTPNAFLRQVRLQRVRDELLRGSAETSVTATALRFGFAHFGRFSASYRAAFKELPSATLRRGRG
jgi:AraC-like DNA-binding protein